MTGDIHIEERELGDDLWLLDPREAGERERWLCSSVYVPLADFV